MQKLSERNPVLAEMLATGVAVGAGGAKIRMHSHLPENYAEALYRAVLASRPKLVVEVGMAFGISTLAILTALEEIGSGKLISIDPHQSSATGWNGCGVAAVSRAGLESRHQLIENFDYQALPALLAAETRIGFGYIDGWHTFDYAFLDFWYLDRMLEAGGVVGFNDCHMTAVDRVIRFMLGHRRYAELDVGLAPYIANYTHLAELKRRLAGKTAAEYYAFYQDRYFRKTADWEPPWDFYARF